MMPLTCPNCGNNTTFSTVGKPGIMRCAKCPTEFPIEGNFTKEES